MKKLGVQITAFNEPRFIEPVIKQFEGLVDELIVVVSAKPWSGHIPQDITGTLAIGTGAHVIVSIWPDESTQRNDAMNPLQDCDYVLVCHADTFFTQEDIKRIKDFIQTATERQYDIQTKMYWKDLDTVVKPDPLLKAMLVRSDVRFIHNVIIEDMSTDAQIVPGVICHHLSWAKTNEEIKTKISTYGHANEIISNWYEDVWLKDKPVDFAPTVPGDYKYKETYSCPEEIRRYFETA